MLTSPSLILASAVPALARSHCAPIPGNLTINLPDVYPESADFATDNCKIYVSSTPNGTLIELDPYTGATHVYQIPGVTGNQSYLTSGVDYSSYSRSIYLSANAGAAFFTNGADLSGPNEMIQFNILSGRISNTIDVGPVIREIEKRAKKTIGGFQDQAEDRFGNIYYMATWGNVILKIDPFGYVSPFYVPPPAKINPAVPGFGGLFIVDNTLVVSDAIDSGFYVFDLREGAKPHQHPRAVTPPAPHVAPAVGLPNTVPSILICDSLYSPERYNGKVALCASDFAYGNGGISVFESLDKWATAKYRGFISNQFEQAPNGTATATFEAGGSVYALVAFLPSADSGGFPATNVFPLVDITSRVDALVK